MKEKKIQRQEIYIEIGDNLRYLLNSFSTSNEIRHALTAIFKDIGKNNYDREKDKV